MIDQNVLSAKLAHGYAQLQRDFLHAAATEGVDDLVEFSRLVATWVTQA